MNWTGGALGRSRNAKASLSAVERAHFARVRGRPEVANLSPPNLEIFGKSIANVGDYNGDIARLARNQHESHSKINNSKRPLEERQPQSYGNRKLEQWRDMQPEERLDKVRSNGHHGEGRALSPITISSQPSSSQSSQRLSEHSPRHSNRGHVSQQQWRTQPDQVSSAIEHQRARLLGMRDWAGLAHTKPPKVKFTESTDRDQIGKRRRVRVASSHDSGQRHQYSQRPRKDRATASDRFSQAEISVRIGSAVDERSSTHERRSRSMSKLVRDNSIPDEMLLDEVECPKADSHSQLPPRIEDRHSIKFPSLLGHGIAPPAYVGDSNDLQSENERAQNAEKSDELSDESTEYNLITVRSPSPCEPLLIMRKPNGQNTPIRFAFQDMPESLDGSKKEVAISKKRRLESLGPNPLNDEPKGEKPMVETPRTAASKREEPEMLHRTFDRPPLEPENLPAEAELVVPQPQDCPAVTDEDEALWRSFVFGDDDAARHSATETQRKSEKHRADLDPLSVISKKQTHASLAVEVSTSPLQQPSRLEGCANSPESTLRSDRDQHTAKASSTSQATNSDEMLDSELPQNETPSSPKTWLARNSTTPGNSSRILRNAPSSNAAQASTSPSTAIDPQTMSTAAEMTPSLIAQASTSPVMTAEPPSDEAGYSPSRLSISTKQPPITFKRPPRYAGTRDSPHMETTIHLARVSTSDSAGRKGRKGRKRSKRIAGVTRQWDVSGERDGLQGYDEIEDE